jgi:predicted enzyme related to lactoylglutathione lyase
MSQGHIAMIGSINWADLTVPDAGAVRDFYAEVVQWKPSSISMGEYDDYAMHTPAADTPAAGICHARGVNADLPAQWLIYITVADLEASMNACRRLGGTILTGPTKMGPYGTYCVIKDPVGAVAALVQQDA